MFCKLGEFVLQTRRIYSPNSLNLVGKLGDFGLKSYIVLLYLWLYFKADVGSVIERVGIRVEAFCGLECRTDVQWVIVMLLF